MFAALNQLPPTTKRIVLGVGAAAGVFLIVRSSSAPEPEPADVAADDGVTSSGLPVSYATDVIGVDQLADFESSVSEALRDIYESIDGWDKPTGVSTAPAVERTVHWTFVAEGESANSIATRLRKAGAKTADGRAITASYLMRFNQWTGTATQKRWPGTRVAY